MPKAAKTIAATSPVHNLGAADPDDRHGRLGAEIAEIEAHRKAIAAVRLVHLSLGWS